MMLQTETRNDLLEFLRWAMEQGCPIEVGRSAKSYRVRSADGYRHIAIQHWNNRFAGWRTIPGQQLHTRLRDAEGYLREGIA